MLANYLYNVNFTSPTGKFGIIDAKFNTQNYQVMLQCSNCNKQYQLDSYNSSLECSHFYPDKKKTQLIMALIHLMKFYFISNHSAKNVIQVLSNV